MIAIAWKKIRNCIIRFDFRLDALGWVPSRSASVVLRKVTMPRTSATTVAILAATSRMKRKVFITPNYAFPRLTATWLVVAQESGLAAWRARRGQYVYIN